MLSSGIKFQSVLPFAAMVLLLTYQTNRKQYEDLILFILQIKDGKVKRVNQINKIPGYEEI